LIFHKKIVLRLASNIQKHRLSRPLNMNVEAIAAVILFLRDQSRHPHLMLPPRQDRVFGIRLCLVAQVDPHLQTNIAPRATIQTLIRGACQRPSSQSTRPILTV
jgi:hypothetical protein